MLKQLSITLALIAALNISTALAKEDISTMPPKPVDNKTLDSMVGTWKGESEMFGNKMQDTLKISWDLNHQFLVTELLAKDKSNPKNHYEGMGLFGVDTGDQIKVWWFDSWGANAVSTGTGSIQSNQLVINDSSPKFKEERTFTMEGNTMRMHAKGTMTMDGKDTPFEQTVTYKKVGK